MRTPAMDDDELLSYGSPRHSLRSEARTRSVYDGDLSRHSKIDDDALLEFYRHRCEQFQQERQAMLDRMAQAEVSKEQYHRLHWDLKAHKEQIVELEEAVRTANATVFQLREEKLALESENELLRIQEQDDRRKIQHLLALTKPVIEEVTFFQDCRPDSTSAYPLQPQPHTYSYPSTMHISSEQMVKEKKRSTMNALSSRGTRTVKQVTYATPRVVAPHQVLRTVYMPSEQASELTKKVEHLRAQLAKQQKLTEDRIQHIIDQCAEEKASLQREHKQLSDANQILTKEVEKSQRILQKTTRDYLVLRHQSQEAERIAHEELHAAKERCDKLEEEKEIAKQQAQSDVEAMHEKTQEESAQCAQELRSQAVSRERDLIILREQYAALQEACARRIQDLQDRLVKLRGRYRSLDKRRSMEMEGFTRDIASLKRHIHRLEGTLYGRQVFVKSQEALRSRSDEILESSDLNEEIAALQERVAELAADVDAS
ncbi:hypothetical protein Poli38472_009441 [Pythium oligandrum]|uniref:Coiled-coil domain-containing protein 77 n=1 Tax=Pythium oligandrum TaxID=41045 RepID=A0A8K1FKQ5_PYTOL|nr:hypothetical protein Poli38472_009441 [Pythium oligandrum]|eukprot:TMW61948.1 hypothetical protein Poli38472_009441 [Pythium oligandrum]